VGEPVIFDIGPGRIRVANQGATGDYEVLVPRSAPSVLIRVGEELLWRKELDSIRPAPPADAPGAYRLPMRGTASR
jgi:hypothetical protein